MNSAERLRRMLAFEERKGPPKLPGEDALRHGAEALEIVSALAELGWDAKIARRVDVLFNAAFVSPLDESSRG